MMMHFDLRETLSIFTSHFPPIQGLARVPGEAVSMIVRRRHCCGVGMSKWAMTCRFCGESIVTPSYVVTIFIAAALLFFVLSKILGLI